LVVLLYILRALNLMRCAYSPAHWAATRERWRKTPTHLIIYEVGGAFMGLILLGALIFLLLVNL
jgi:hypothetical protein